MRIPDRRAKVPGKSTVNKMLKVGSAPDADIQINQATVSRLHCALEWTGTAWSLRDLGSTNGTFVNGERLAAPHLLKPTDQVTLGRGIPLAIPPAPSPTDAAPKAVPVAKPIALPKVAPRPHSKRPGTPAWLIPTLVSMISLIVFGWLMFGRPSSSPVVDASGKSNSEVEVLDTKEKTSNSIVEQKRSGSKDIGTVKPKPSPVAAKFDSPFYAVVIESKDGKKRKLLGTAVAVDAFRMLTMASIVEAAEQMKSEFPMMRLYHKGTEMVGYSPVTKTVHPQFVATLAALNDFATSNDEKISQVTELKEPSLKERLETSAHLEKIMRENAQCDVACLVVKEEIPRFLKMPNLSMESRDSSACRLIGFPTIFPIPDVKAGVDSFLIQGDAEYKREQTPQSTSHFVETTDFTGLPIVSMVCLNEKGELIGLCVRPVPDVAMAQIQRCEIAIPQVFWHD